MFRHSLFSLLQEHNLRAVRYLPDILALLRILTDRFHRRIDREKANQLKIRELLQEFPKKGSTVHPYLSKVFASDLCSEDLVLKHCYEIVFTLMHVLSPTPRSVLNYACMQCKLKTFS